MASHYGDSDPGLVSPSPADGYLLRGTAVPVPSAHCAPREAPLAGASPDWGAHEAEGDCRQSVAPTAVSRGP